MVFCRMKTRKLHVVHLLNELMYGGLERKLQQFVLDYPADQARHTIIVMGRDVGFSHLFNACSNAEIIAPRVEGDASNLSVLLRRIQPLVAAIKKSGPVDILHSWAMPTHPFIPIAQMAAPEIKGRVIAMDFHSMLAPPAQDPLKFRLTNTFLRNVVANDRTKIVTVSPEMKQGLLARAYNPRSIEYIPNGVNTGYFSPQPDAEQSVKSELGLEHVRYLTGIASRHGANLSAQYKDVPNMVQSALALKLQNPELYKQCGFIICGQGTDAGDLRQLAQTLGVAENMRFLGPRDDMSRLYSSWTISNVCSLTEPFGLVVPEAMACETPCVVTNVSLFPEMVGETGAVVPVQDPNARARAWDRILNMPQDRYHAMAKAGRQRVAELYSNKAMVEKYIELYQDFRCGPG